MLLSSLFYVITGPEYPREAGAGSSPIEPSWLNSAPNAQNRTGHSSTVRPFLNDAAQDLPAKMSLSFSENPVLNREARLNLFLYPEIDAPNTEVRILLPDGFSLSCGNLQWNGDLSRDAPIRMGVSVKAEIVGSWHIGAVATSKSAKGCPKVCSTTCYARVAEEGVYVLDSSPEDPAQAEAVEADSCRSTAFMGQSPSDNVTVRGYWFYENQSGSTRPVRQAMVELWASKLPSDVRLATTYVQSDGYYEFPPVINNDSSSGGGCNLYVKLLCESYPYHIVQVGVSGSYLTIWSQTDIHYNVIDEYHDMGTWIVTGDKTECWAAYDSIVDGYFWLLNKVGWSRGTVRVITQDQMSMSLGNTITLYPGDGWNRDTVLHEYGHCIHYTARGGSFPPKSGPDEHYPDTETDGGWAITEGWAEFFACAVDNRTAMCGGGYGSIESTVYADSPFGHGDRGDWDGDEVEGAVSQVFWDILDGVSPSDYPQWDEAYGDYVSDEFDQLWHIFQTHKPNNIEAVWDLWTPKDSRIWAIFRHAKIPEPRNIVVTCVVPSHEGVAVGQALSINVTVENQGDTLETINLTVSADYRVIGHLDNVTLGTGNSAILTVVCDTVGMTKGDYAVSARAILFPRDSNVIDDVKNGVFTLVSSGHDVGLGNVVMSKVVDGLGYILTIRMDARNIGNCEEAFNVTVSANSTIIGTFPAISLAVEHSRTLTLVWDTATVQKGSYSIVVSASTTSNDIDMTDNTVQNYVFITIPGDVDGDFDVSLSDLSLLAKAYSSKSGDLNWNPNADIDGNGIVDLSDLVALARHYGPHYP